MDLSRWRSLPCWLMIGGGAGAVLGWMMDPGECVHSWLLAFLFYLSLGLGALFLVLVHHLFDAGWSVPIRRSCEHLACLLVPRMALLFIPVALGARVLYGWMNVADPHGDPALAAKLPLFTRPVWFAAAVFSFLVWGWLSNRLRHWSVEQDKTGAADCTYRLRRYSAGGVFLFAITLTLASILWMKGMTHQWFSAMYGVYYFAGSVWVTLATVYVLAVVLQRSGALAAVLHARQFHFLGSLMLAFTVFYAYIHFSQYFIIWNANVPEETFWYVIREKGSWFHVGLVLIFGHVLIPFLALLRVDLKQALGWMIPLCLWAWLMHYVDLSFNILPVRHPDGFPFAWMWLHGACLAFMGGLLAKGFVRDFRRHAAYPIRDPRLLEALGRHHPVASTLSGGVMDLTESPAGNTEAQTHGGAK